MIKKHAIVDKFQDLNWSLVMLITVTASIGFAMLYSAAEGNINPWAFKQIIRFAVLLPIMVFIAMVNIRIWLKMAYILYFIVLAMLVFTEFFGVTAMGATRWIRIGPFNIQPSEIMKVFVILALARYFHTVSLSNIQRIAYVVPPIFIIIVPALLILRQPDLGTALILVMIGVFMLFAGGVKIWKFVVAGVVSIGSIPFIWTYLHQYQKNRILSFLNPEDDHLGNGYNILQSKIAIGSGGFYGKGFLQGTQSQLSFLPEKQTDFIFTMLTEEFGFIGGVAMITLYAIIIVYGFSIALSSNNHFGRLVAIGVTSMIFIHVFVNIAMVMGMIPVVGAPLPLLSYGGTIMMTMLLAFGFLLNSHLYSDEMIDKAGD